MLRRRNHRNKTVMKCDYYSRSRYMEQQGIEEEGNTNKVVRIGFGERVRKTSPNNVSDI